MTYTTALKSYHQGNNSARLCNEALEKPMNEAERSAMIQAASQKLEELFDILRIDHRNDHNTRDTPTRVAKMFVEELLEGRFTSPPRLTEFENVHDYDQLIVSGPIQVRSMCAHHLMPIYGSVFIGILPARDGKIIGLSKYDRIADYFSARLQIQEELVKQIGQYIFDTTKPRGLAVRMSAVHMCKTHRGVRASHRGRMINTCYWGDMSGPGDHRTEFLSECLALDSGSDR